MDNNVPKIEVRHTSIIIRNYNIGDCQILENILSVYDPIRHSRNYKGMYYDEDTKILYIPRGIDINLLEKYFKTQATMNYDHDPVEKVSIHAKIPPRDNMQRDAIAYLIGAGKYQYTKKYSQLLLQLPPDSGKTYIVTSALQFIGERPFIILPNEKLKDQMIKSLLKFTDIGEEFIIDICGKKDIDMINKTKSPKWKVYVTCHGTLISYAKNNGWKSIEDLFKHCKIGLKIYDEAHMFFENILKIDFHTNTKKTIYMTATFKRSDYNENTLFNKCFKNVVSFNLDDDKKKRKHIMYIGLQYNSHPSLDKQSFMTTKMGFNKIRYSNYQVEQDAFYDALDYAIKYFKKYEGKILILCTTIAGVEKIKDFLNDAYTDMSVSSYHSKIVGEERDKAFTADIICTTPQSAGVGADIPGLRVAIMCESYSSHVEAEQVSGRLREFNDTDNTFYIELIDIGFPKVYKMWKARLPIFKKKCKKLVSIDLTTKK